MQSLAMLLLLFLLPACLMQLLLHTLCQLLLCTLPLQLLALGLGAALPLLVLPLLPLLPRLLCPQPRRLHARQVWHHSGWPVLCWQLGAQQPVIPLLLHQGWPCQPRRRCSLVPDDHLCRSRRGPADARARDAPGQLGRPHLGLRCCFRR